MSVAQTAAPEGAKASVGEQALARGRRAALREDPRARSAALWLALPLAIMLLCWRELPLQPSYGEGAGLATSWEAGMHMALHEGITFGRHLMFTYGPLGFLSVPTLFYGDTGTIAVLYAVLLRFLLALAVFAGARRTYGTLVGAIVALVVLIATGSAIETVPFLVLAVWILDRDPPARRRLGLMALCGAVAGVQLLDKSSVGIELAVLAVILAIAAQGRRALNLLVTLAAMAIALLVAWLASGQELGALPAFAHNSAQVISGYSAAMGDGYPGLAWEYFAALIAFAFGLVAAVKMTADGPAARRWGIVALWVAFCFFEFKEGFTRHDADHAEIFFAALMGGFLAMRWLWGGQRVGLALVGVMFVFSVAAQGKEIIPVLDPVANAANGVTQVVQVLNPSENAAITQRGRRSVKRAYHIDPQTLSLLEGHTVHVTPYATAVVWAYELKWGPLPVFQSYAAYTPALDTLDAEDINSARAPERILRNRDIEIDNRLEAFDEGLTSLTILCRYQELRTTLTLQVLGLVPDRCGATVALGTVHARWGQRVAIPAPPSEHSFVFVRIGGTGVSGLESVRALIARPAERFVHLDGISHRLVEGTAEDGLILRAPAAVDFAHRFRLAPDAATIAVHKAGTSSGGKPITYSFFATSVNSSPRGPFPPPTPAPRTRRGSSPPRSPAARR